MTTASDLVIDPNRTFAVAEKYLAEETNPVKRARLENILEHFKGEAVLDIDRILWTLSPIAQYVIVGGSFTPPGQARMVLDSHEEIRGFYEGMLANTRREMQYDVEEMTVDESMILQRGTNRIAVTGSSLAAGGVDVIDDPDVFYMMDVHATSVFPFDEDGLCLGEQIFEHQAPTTYFDEPIDLSRIGTIRDDL